MIMGDDDMIVFDKLWETMKEKGISQYQLIKKYGISTGQLDRLRKNQNVNSYTLNELCEILDCELRDIAEYKKEEKNYVSIVCNGYVYFFNRMRKQRRQSRKCDGIKLEKST